MHATLVAIGATLVGIGALAGFIAFKILDLIWWLLKLFIAACVLIGALQGIFQGLSLGNHERLVWYQTAVASIMDVGSHLIANWIYVAIVVIFVWAILLKKRIDSIESDVTHTKVAIVTLANYFQIEVQTEGMKKLQQEGLSSLSKEAIQLNVFGALLGRRRQVTDDALTARPVRNGASITFAQDLENRIGNIRAA